MTKTADESDEKVGTESEADLRRLKILYQKVDENKVEKAWKRFEDAGFKPILIKGWAASINYDDPADRRYNDVDLAFDRAEFPSAEKFLAGLKTLEAIDLHDEFRHLDVLEFKTLYQNAQVVKCGNTDLRILRPEDHLRILCVHWLNDGGARRERLWDIYYAVKNRPKDFDWNACLNVVSRKRRRWIVCTIGLAHRYLDLEIKDTPIAEEAETLPKWLVKAVEKEWQSETFIRPLHFLLGDWRTFWLQLRKRIPPNPIQATIEMEGDFDRFPRIYYQLSNIFWRLPPFIKRVLKQHKN